jgi:hypothetical protein
MSRTIKIPIAEGGDLAPRATDSEAHENSIPVELSDEELAVVREYASEHALSEEEAVHHLAVQGLAERVAKTREERPRASATQ